ncbi:MAG: trypsin-like serine peptidase [Rhodosalinus sp.]|uniref:trypsin-like serine peptidase n=1 Tax=Rhodosalinus sp. TaxID=2047741 RepID=UPI00397A96E6
MRLIAAVLALALAATGALAQNRLETLDTGDKSRGWEAVGRLDIGGTGFCTGALIAPDLVLTAAHCLFDKDSGARLDHREITFLAGWRNGRAEAYRAIRRAVAHPNYVYQSETGPLRVQNDVALLELVRPIRNTTVIPFATGAQPGPGAEIGVVSYARDRAEAPSLQEVCRVRARQSGVLVMDCDVDFGASGAPVFSIGPEGPRIVSVVSAMAEMAGRKVSLGTALEGPLALLHAELAAGRGLAPGDAPSVRRIRVGEETRKDMGAKFVTAE